MTFSIDIETIPNASLIDALPEPDVALGNLKDQAKIAEKREEARAKQVEKMGLDPMFGRVACCAYAWASDAGVESLCDMLPANAINDDGERFLIQEIMRKLGAEGARIVTFNGKSFDIPFVYRRAFLLGVNPADFGAPPCKTWIAKYNNDRHYDMMLEWTGGAMGQYVKLETLAMMALGVGKEDADYTKFAEMLTTEDGRAQLAAYNQQDSILTYKLFERAIGCLFV